MWLALKVEILETSGKDTGLVDMMSRDEVSGSEMIRLQY